MANAPRPGAGRRADANNEDLRISFEWGGETYTVRPNEVTAKITGQLRRLTGFSMVGLIHAAETDFDTDVVAALIYVARRQRGENVDYDRIADSVMFRDADTFKQVEDEPDEDAISPEA